MAAVLGRASDGSLIRKAGVMAVILEGGLLTAGDRVTIEWLPDLRQPLEPV
ncbi:MAG TPA: hypothetical protein VNR60_12230 [Croceibacterium sp.]|nr:hypothetical protein [Croceibacterium sp.]